jgi:Mn-dependent DtxR family transcriptional regulator
MRRRRNHARELLEEIQRIVALKKQIPRYADIARAHGVSVQVVRHLISQEMPALRTKVLVHVEPRRKPMTREELDRMAAQLMRSSL